MDKRITDIEIKLTYQDDLIQTLNDVVAKLQQQVDGLQQKVSWLEERPATRSDGTTPNEPPPHY